MSRDSIATVRPIGLAEAILGEIDFLRPQQGRVKAGGSSSPKRGFSFSPRASQLWRFSLGSSAAVLKKIGKGGTANAKELAAQMDYLFSKSASIFGNGVVLDADAKGLTKDERNDSCFCSQVACRVRADLARGA